MAEAPKLNTSRYTAADAKPTEAEKPVVTEKPAEAPVTLKNRYKGAMPPNFLTIEPGAVMDVPAQNAKALKSTLARGVAGMPGTPMELINFGANIPKHLIDAGGWAAEELYNMATGSEFDFPPASEKLGLEEVRLPGGFDDMKRWLGAPEYTPASDKIGRITQGAIEGGLESIGPGFFGALLKKAAPKIADSKNVLKEIFAPSRTTLPKQTAIDAAAGSGMGAGMQYGVEEDDPAAGLALGALGVLLPTGAASGRRGLSRILGAREPSKFTQNPWGWSLDLIAPPGGIPEAKAHLTETMDALHPGRRYALADELDRAAIVAKKENPEIDFTTGMLSEDPALRYLLSGAETRSGTLIDEAANKATDQLRQKWQQNSPGGDVNAPQDYVMSRVEKTVANMSKKRKKAEADAAAAEERAGAIANELNAENALAEKTALGEDLQAGIVSEANKAKQEAGAALEEIKNSGAKISGTELENWRTQLIKQADMQGQKGTIPDFLNPKVGGLNEELYPTAFDGVTPPTVLKAPVDKDIAQVIGWDQVLREQETAARLAGDSTKAHWTGEARRQLNSLLETQLGSAGYTDAKKAYLDNVVKRFYTPTVDPLLGPKHLDVTTGAKAVQTGPKGAQAAKDVLLAIGDDTAAGKAFVDYTLADFAGYAYNVRSGKLDVAKANSWLKTHAPMIAELRKQGASGTPTASTLANLVVDKIDDAMKNQGSLDEALTLALDKAKRAGERETKWTASLQNKSAARFVLGKDPEVAVKSILSSPNLAEDAKALNRLLAKDAAAQVGMQQAIFDNLTNEMSTITAKLNPKNMRDVPEQINKALTPYQKLEEAGTLPKGFTKRARLALETEYTIRRVDKGNAGGSTLMEGAKMSQADISQFGRGIFGSRSGNLIAGVARDVFGQPGTVLLHKILRDAALDPAKMSELLRAEAKGKTALRAVLIRQAASHGYNAETENGGE